MRYPGKSAFVLWLSVACMAGCSSSKPLEDAAAGAGDGAGPGRGEGGEGGKTDEPPADCDGPGYHVESKAVTIDQVTATLRDPSGKAVPSLLVQVCGLDICVNGATNSAGKTSVAPRVALTRPAFKYGDGFEFGKLAVLLGREPTQDLGALVAVPLPDYADGGVFTGHGDVTNGDLTLSIASGTRVDHDILTYSDESQLTFRSAAIPLADSERAADPSLGFELAFVVAPVGTLFCPPARLSLKNSLDWAPNTDVEVFIQGLEVGEALAPYADWVQVAEARVSADGKRIDSTSGGIPILSSIAVRRKK